jgi:hypothetical protein
LRTLLQSNGLTISANAELKRGGVRDLKWRLIEPLGKPEYVLRQTDKGVDVYDELRLWRNPLRRVPQPIELALALGARPGVQMLKALSSRTAEYVRIAENSWSVADAMSAVSGTPFVVDSSKSPLRWKLLYMLVPQRIRVIELIRDGRAVAASAMRRQRISAENAARVWKRDNSNIAIMLRSVPRELRIQIRYEDLCEQPHREIERLCGFLGLKFEPQMPTLWQRPVHNIPGNTMLFNRTRQTISRDDRWQDDLSVKDLEAFDRIAGRLNRAFGYA